MGDRRSQMRSRAGTGAIFALTIALTAVVGASLIRFPFGASQPFAQAPDAPALASAMLTGTTPEPSATPTHEITVVTRPAGARVTVTPSGGAAPAVSGHSPLTATVSEGEVQVDIAHAGRASRTETLPVNRDRTYTWWLDPKGALHHKVAQFAGVADPARIAFGPDGRQLWSATAGTPGIAVHRAPTGEPLAEIDLGAHGAADLAFTTDGSTAYALQARTGTLYEIDTATFDVRRRLATPGVRGGQALALAPDAQHAYVARPGRDEVAQIDLADGSTVRRFATAAAPRALQVTDDMLYVGGSADGRLQRFDLDGDAGTTLAATGGTVRVAAIDARDARLYAADADTGTVLAHDLGSAGVRELVVRGTTARALALGADGRVLYLPGTPTGKVQASVLAVDARTGDVLDTIAGRARTSAIAVSPDGARLAFVDSRNDRVHVYETPTYATLSGDAR